MLCACHMVYVLYCIMRGMCDAGSVLYHIVPCIGVLYAVLCACHAVYVLCCIMRGMCDAESVLYGIYVVLCIYNTAYVVLQCAVCGVICMSSPARHATHF